MDNEVVMDELLYYPELVRLDATWRCNLRCKHCQTGMFREPGSHYSDLSTEELEELFKQLSRLGTKQIGFLGGEPLLRHDLVSLAWTLHSLGIRPSITSNGWLINDRMAYVLTQEVPVDVAVSLDGPDRSSHDNIRGKGSFERAVKALQQLVKYRGRSRTVLIGISAVVHRHCQAGVNGFLDLANKLDVDYMVMAIVHPVGTAKQYWDELSVDQKQVLPLTRTILKHFQSGEFRFALRLNFLTPAMRDMLSSEGWSLKGIAPYYDRAGLYECYVQCDGRVFPSQKLSEMVPEALASAAHLGLDFSDNSIRNKSMQSIWFGPSFEAYRQLVLSKVHIANYQSCQRCPFSQSSCFPTAVPFLEGTPHAQDICAYLYSAGLGPFHSKVA